MGLNYFKMKNSKLYIQSLEDDFLKVPIYLNPLKISKKYIIADLEEPINIWKEQKLYSYSRVLLKPRFFFQSFNKINKKKKLTVNVASFDNCNIDDFEFSSLELICICELVF